MRKRYVTKTPRTWLGTLLEAVTGFYGRSVIVGRDWYLFRKGRFTVAQARHADRADLCITDAGEASESDIAYLRSLTGSRWSVSHNCVTALSPVWRRKMSGVSSEDRQSIARSVVVAVVAVALMLVGMFFFIDRWADGKVQAIREDIANLKRATAAYYGNHRKAIEELKESER